MIETLEARTLWSAAVAPWALRAADVVPSVAMLLAGTPKAPTVTVTKIGTTGLKLSWPAPTASELAPISKFRITYTPGMWAAGSIGQKKTIDVSKSATSVTLSGLLPFTLYSIDVSAMDAAGKKSTTHKNWWTAAPATQKRYLYLFNLPKNRQGFTNSPPQIEVFDVNAGHKWVKNIPLPKGIYNVRGVAASAATKKLYVAFFNGPADSYQPGGLLCIDVMTNKVLWQRKYDKSVIPSPDRFDISPDGSKLYVPVGEHGTDNFWVVLDAKTGDPITRITHVTAPHNTIVSADGTRAFLEGQEKGTQPASYKHTVAVVDTATNKVIKRVGPFRDVVRPFTVNGKGSLIFATVNNWVGFQVADVATGRILYTAAPPNYVLPNPPLGGSLSHGIAMTADEKTIWVVDTLKIGVHVWDISKTPGSAPKYLGFVKTRASGKTLSGVKDPNASNDTNGVPAWIVPSLDGKYMYPESGEIIDVATRKVVGQLRGKKLDSTGKLVDAPYSHSRFILEVDFDGGKLMRVTDQFGIGRVR